MAIIRCARGHYYDTSKYSECPTCRKLETRTSELREKIGSESPVYSAAGADDTINDDVTMPMIEQDGRTVELGAARRKESGGAADDAGVTVALFSEQRGTAFVTGWIVCIRGPLQGRDFRLRHGMNWVGTSFDSDVCLNGADRVEAVRHCMIAYDDHSNHFFIVAGKGGLTYLNDRVIREPVQLNLGDQLDIGNCSFEFVPFCREGRLWKVEKDLDDGKMSGDWVVSKEEPSEETEEKKQEEKTEE